MASRAELTTPDLSGPELPPIFFSPEGSPLQRTYRALLREASRRDALDERQEQEKKHKQSFKSAAAISEEFSVDIPSLAEKHHQPVASANRLDGQHVQIESFTNDLLERAGISTAERQELRDLSTASGSKRSEYSRASSSGTALPTISPRIRDQHSSSGSYGSATPTSPPRTALHQSRHRSGTTGGSIISEDKLKQNHNLVEVLNDVQQVTLCFQEIIKHISFHRVNTGRVLWKLQATYVQLFEKMVKVFARREKKQQDEVAEAGGEQNQELDLLRLQVMDGQAKLDAAEKTKVHYQDTIKEQTAQINVLNAEVDTLRAALVEEAAAAEAAVQRREEEEKEIRHKVQLDVKKRSDARRALFGGHEPSELDSAFANSLGTMHDTIEDADVRMQEQESLLSDMNSLMDVQQVCVMTNCYCFIYGTLRLQLQSRL